MVFNATFNNISVISWQSVLLVEETGVPGENHLPVTSHWQTLSHNLLLLPVRSNVVSVLTLSVLQKCVLNYISMFLLLSFGRCCWIINPRRYYPLSSKCCAFFKKIYLSLKCNIKRQYPSSIGHLCQLLLSCLVSLLYLLQKILLKLFGISIF